MKVKVYKEVDNYCGQPLLGFAYNERVSDDFLIYPKHYLPSERNSKLVKEIIHLLYQKNCKLTVAESLTGGLLSSTIVSVSGASSVFDSGYVSYSNSAKIEKLGVKDSTLKQCGAVSYDVAVEMAAGVRIENGYSLSTTGIAGPNGDGICNKVGTVFVGVSTPEKTYAKGFLLKGRRNKIREETVKLALGLLLKELKNIEGENKDGREEENN